MNYYLDDLRTLLATDDTDCGYTGYDINTIYVDKLIEPSNLTSINEFILLQAQGGTATPTVYDNRDFAVWVYRRQPSDAQDVSNNIWRYLNGWSGSLGVDNNSVNFRRVLTRQTPMPFHSSQIRGINSYMFTMTAQINSSDLLFLK